MEWCASPDGRPGRPLRFSDRAIEFCLTLKGLFQLPLRQVTGLTQSLLGMAGLDWPAPDYTTLCRRQKSLSVDLGGRSSSGGLHLLVDSTGIKMLGEGEWSEEAQPVRGTGEHRTRKHGVLALGHAPGMAVACDTAVNGARCPSASTRKRWISGRSR